MTVVMEYDYNKVINAEDEIADVVEILEFLEHYGDSLTITDVKQILTDRVFDLRSQIND